jgi:general secretion pathway protein H
MKSQRGFSLIELVVVLVLIAAITGIGAMTIAAASPGRQLKNAARELSTQLRFTRAQAIASGHEQVFEIDVANRRWTAAGKRSGELAEDIELLVTTAREESPARDIAAVRFFPDGAATGGRIVLKIDEAAWRIDVGWLTGEVKLQAGEGSR